jgi:hypothetical protein
VGQYFIERRYVVFMDEGISVESGSDALYHPRHQRTRAFPARGL